MPKKRTRKQKESASRRLVNSQFTIEFKASTTEPSKKEKSIDTAQYQHTASIKKDLLNSLIIASLIVISLVVLYWFS